jgi:Chlorophyll A-B binding protein
MIHVITIHHTHKHLNPFHSQVSLAAGERSKALPFEPNPPSLDGSLIGDVGFDPFGFSTVDITRHFNNVFGKDMGISPLTWLREAELMHGRICQVAVVGMIAPSLFGTLPGSEWTGVDAYSNTNPIEAITQVPVLAVIQIIAFMSYLEVRRIGIILEEGSNYMPGDSRFGQGPGRYNPFKFNYSPDEYAEKQLQELKHCRLSMLGFLGLYLQAVNSGVGIGDQLGQALSVPDYYGKAGYFFPEGI